LIMVGVIGEKGAPELERSDLSKVPSSGARHVSGEAAYGVLPRPRIGVGGAGVVSHAGAALLTAAIARVGLDEAMSQALAPWRRPHGVHDPAKVILDLAVTLALGGDCLADIALLRSSPGVFGLVASDPTVSRMVYTLAGDVSAALAAIGTARAAAPARAWQLAGQHAPDDDVDPTRPVVIDVDATLVTAHSDKEQAAPTFKKGFGFHPLWAFVDHGRQGTGEPLSVLLRKGNAGSVRHEVARRE
jgi:Transposase DDE domain group 1